MKTLFCPLIAVLALSALPRHPAMESRFGVMYGMEIDLMAVTGVFLATDQDAPFFCR